MFRFALVLAISLSTNINAAASELLPRKLADVSHRAIQLNNWAWDCACENTVEGKCTETSVDVQFCMVYFTKMTGGSDKLTFAAMRTLDSTMPYEFALFVAAETSNPDITDGKVVLKNGTVDLSDCAFSACLPSGGGTSAQFDEVVVSRKLQAQLFKTGATTPALRMTIDGRGAQALITKLRALPRH